MHALGDDPTWEQFLLLTSVPLRQISKSGKVVGTASSVLVWLRGTLILITAGHIRSRRGDWAVEVRYDPDRNETQIFTLSRLRVIKKVTQAGGKWVDLAFMIMPPDFRPKFQSITGVLGHGRVDLEEERLILASDLRAEPRPGRRYGFAGQIEFQPIDHPIANQFIAGDTQIETHLTFKKKSRGRYVFKLTHPHLGHAMYKGCSGAPILDKTGTLVSIVLRGSEARDEIYGLPLADYRHIISAAKRPAG